jgi:hypothetical protein
MGWKERTGAALWLGGLGLSKEKWKFSASFLIFDSNFTGTPSRTIHKSEILPAQRQFIQQCRER